MGEAPGRGDGQDSSPSVLDCAPDAIVVIDDEGLIQQCNPAAVAFFGYGAGELLGRNVNVLMPSPQRQEHDGYLQRYCRGGEPHIIGLGRDVQARRKDGTLVSIHLKVAELRQPNGTRRFVGFMRDVSDRVRVLTELEEHRHHLEALVASRTAQLAKVMENLQVLVEQAPISIAMLDPGMNYLAASGRWIEEYGRGRTHIVGLNHYELHPDLPAAWKEVHRRVLAGESVRQAEDCWTWADGSRLWLRWAALPWRDASGDIGGIIMSAEDITVARQLAEDLAEAHRQALHLAQVKSDFLANMSHEIRTPLHAIVGLTHLLQGSNPGPQQAEKLARIGGAAEHLLSIVSDVLDLTKIEAGKLELEHTDFRLSQVCDTVDHLIRENALAKGLALALDCPRRLLEMDLVGDPNRLVQVLVNLGGNAVKFTERGSVILRATAFDESEHDIELRFEVLDTGIGIAESAIPRLFADFEQADNSTTRKHGGTGLGLAISRRLLELMGSTIGVESRVGAGSRFHFALRFGKRCPGMPARASDASDADLGAVLAARHAGARVLLVEDDAVNQMIAIELLRLRGLVVDVANDGVEAVAMAEVAPYDVILMDVQMPRLNGIDAAHRIRAQPWGRRIPILAMTASAFSDDRQRCLDAGMNDFLAKPVAPRELHAALLRHLRPARDEAVR